MRRGLPSRDQTFVYSLAKFRSFCGFHLRDFRSLDVVGTRGGLITAWNPFLFDCIDDWGGSFSLNVVLKNKSDGSVFLISNIYGPTCANLKDDFFLELRSISLHSHGRWAVLGDFNALLSLRDKNGIPSNTNEIFTFRELVNDLSLIDLPLLNKSYTWSNGRRNSTLERLDRAFISEEWLLSFPRSTLRALPQPHSDHTPLLLSASSFVPSSTLFRFESFCLRYPVFFGGDANTKFFQFRASCRRSKNTISRISDGNAEYSTHGFISNHLSSFFQGFLVVEQPVTDFNINLNVLYGNERVDLSSLDSAFSVEEVKGAIFSSAPKKSLGPDRFPMLFYQRFWSTLKDDIMAVFNSFHSDHINLRKINSSWVCPIPKKKDIVSARDLRPINLIHGLAKIISKVLATRLQSFMAQLINPFQTAFIRGRHILDNFFAAHILVHHLHSSNSQAAIFKIDFERAFDHINWNFLSEILQARGFGNNWIRWISCLL
uniref:Uncharacterized protein n=1 Tax=Ananas comosus var. bracteatus TaxID=296719 RepID=A0A6V7PF03_ANACO|nr:unnamed protein product [Ananas comosus var. bracteatus]